MKKNIFFKGLAAVALAGTMMSCSEDYLDVSPVTDVTQEQVMSSVAGARQALSGAIEMMCRQYAASDMQSNNSGEAFEVFFYGEILGQDLLNGLWTGNVNFDWDWALGSRTARVSAIPWTYYYQQISNVNKIIEGCNIDPESGLTDEEIKELQFIKASAYTIRAHCYHKLMQLFAQRWEDSNNGENYCIVLRLDTKEYNAPLAKGIDVYKQIYEDLDEAIRLYEESGLNRSNKWEVNENVAKGIYARVALMRHDWPTAQKMAKEAREGFSIMSNDEYMSGFANDCSGFIWHQYPGYDTTYYWSWGAWQACNGAYVFQWGRLTGGAMNIDLYNKMDPNDIRRNLYLMPDKVKWLSKSQNKGNIKESDFWDPTMVDVTNNLNLALTSCYVKGDSKNKGMYNVAAVACFKYMTDYFKGNIDEFTDDTKEMNYITMKSRSDVPSRDLLVKKNTYVNLSPIQFGAQFKFWGHKPYGNMAFPWMRAAEMALTEAEAAAMQPDQEAAAKKALTEVQKLRIPGYTCTSTGQALIDEIRIARRVELWGEGFSWFDLKRWNLPMERRVWVENDPTSGNVAPEMLGSDKKMARKEPSDNNGWTMTIPNSERTYNEALDTSLLPFGK